MRSSLLLWAAASILAIPSFAQVADPATGDLSSASGTGSSDLVDDVTIKGTAAEVETTEDSGPASTKFNGITVPPMKEIEGGDAFTETIKEGYW